MSTNAMNFGPAWMRGDIPRQARSGEGEGRSSPIVQQQANGSPAIPMTQQLSSSPAPHPGDSSLHPPNVNGMSYPHGRASSFSYSSVLASTPTAQSPTPDGQGATNNSISNHDRPFKYTRDEMLNIWRNNATKFKTSGIPLEFEKHETFTSDEPLEPALLTEMTALEKEAFAGPLNSDRPDIASQGRLDRSGRQFSPRAERFPSGLSASSGRSAVNTRNRTSSRSESSGTSHTTARPPAPRGTKSREYFTGAFAGSSSGTSPPEKDLWGSATKKGSFDENGKFIIADYDEKDVQPPEPTDKMSCDVMGDPGDLVDIPASSSPAEASESPSQISDGFSLPLVAGRTTSRFSSFATPDDQKNPAEDETRQTEGLPPSGQTFQEDHETDVFNDILSMAAPPREISPPRQMDRLTSRFAQQSLGPEPSNYGSFGAINQFDVDPVRRDSAGMSQFFPGAPPPIPGIPKSGLFEHPVVPQPSLPPPPPQTTRVMIMADKLKWVYKDPQGNIQGPFTGLEMHEWYRGGYFHPTLEVKREDDNHFEPLQTLVKRIGNQREPFLVPLPSKTQTQVIPPRSTTTLSGWNTTLFGEGLEENKWVGPPMPTNMSGGTTLTADQQNALERRKQEEQYLLARQRELATSQQLVPPVQFNTPHHTAPQHAYVAPGYGGYTPVHPLPMGVTHHVHSPAPVQVQTLPALDTLRTGGSTPATQTTPQPTQQPQSPLEHQGQAGMGYQLAQQNRTFMSPWGAGPLGPLSPGVVQMHQSQNLESFQQQYDEEPPPSAFPQEEKGVSVEAPIEAIPTIPEPVPEPADQSRKSSVSAKPDVSSPILFVETPEVPDVPQEEFVVESILPENYEESQVVAADFSVAVPPPVRAAPWATPQKKDDGKKSLTLKQIQEIETKRATEQARRIAAEKQLLAQQAAALAAQPTTQPGLPQSSTWGSVVTKSWAAKTASPTPSLGKKSMAQIQKEEEEEQKARLAKKEAATLASPARGYAGAAAAASTPKPAVPTSWTMVGPGGRPQPGRPIHSGGSNTNVPVQPNSASSPARPTPARTTSMDQKQAIKPAVQTQGNGIDEFQKWCRSQLKSLSGVQYDEIYQMMVSLPPNESSTQEIISDTIYAYTSTLDGRHFAEEFVKRRKVLGPALDTTLPSSSTGTTPTSSGSGWNEVLKKDKSKDPSGEWNSAFKVVAGKKGRRRG